MTAITELGSAGIATSTFMVPDWSLPDWSNGTTPAIAFERPNGIHGKADAMPVVTFDVPNVAVNLHSPTPHSPVVLENPAVHSPRNMEAFLPSGMTPQQFSEELDGAVRSRYGISRVAFEAAWSNGNHQQTNPTLERTWVHLPVTQREIILSAIPDVRPPGQPDWDVDWHGKTVHNALSRLARESGHTPDDLMAMTPGSALDTQIRGNAHWSKLLAKVERHERYLADAREKQGVLDQKWSDDHYAYTYATKIYEPVRVARDAAIAASDTKVAHVLYTDGKPAKDVPFEGYGQSVDVRGKRLTAIHQTFDPRVAQDLALEAEAAVEAAEVARAALTKAQTDGDGFGPRLMSSGMPISAFVYGAFRVIDEGTEGIHNPAVRNVVRKAAKITVAGGLAVTGAGLLGGCVAPPTPHAPTLPPPGAETSLPAAHETGAMMARMPEVSAFYNALTTHGVDASACSPDVLGGLVDKKLPLETVIDLTAIATNALANTPEPDHLKAMVCDAIPGANGTQTVGFYFLSDQTEGGTPDIFIPSLAQMLLPGQLVDGVPEVVAPVVEGQPPAGSSVMAPDWSASGGEIPVEIRELMTVEEQSIRASFAAQGIDPKLILIHPVSRGSGKDFRMGSGITNLDRTIAYYPVFDDSTSTKEYAWRPDRRPSDRSWHWEQVSQVGDGKIEVVFDPDSEAPQYVELTPDETQMIGWFNNLTGQWLTKDGKELTQTLASTATLPATIPAPATETPAPSATPAELTPTSCLVEQKSQDTFDAYLQNNNLTREAFIAQAQESFSKENRGYGLDETRTYSFGAGLPGILLGEYGITIDFPGLSGKGNCVVVAYPSSEGISVSSFLVDASIDGQYSNALIMENTGNPQDNLKTTSEATRQWLAERIGKVIRISVPVAHNTKVIQNAVVYSPIWKRLFTGSYVERFGNNPQLINEVTNPRFPDPAQIVGHLDPQKEIGLFIDTLEDTTP